jgi:predicted permease
MRFADGVLPWPVAIALRMYRALARAFPQEFQNVYGDELLHTAEDSIDEIWRLHGLAGLFRVLLDIVFRILAEYISELRQDCRYGLRMLAASPGFTAVALVSLSLGICVVTCAYSVTNGMLRDLPGAVQPDRLVALNNPSSYPNYRRYRELNDIFVSTFAYVAPVPFTVSTGGGSIRAWGHLVTPSYFSTLGVHPSMGRFFDEANDRPEPAAVISYRFWEDHLGSDSSIVGRTVRINGQSCTIIGIGPSGFFGASPGILASDLWLPVSAGERFAPELAGDVLDRRELTMFRVVGRLRPGVTEAAAHTALNAVAQELAQSYGDPGRHRKEPRVNLVAGGMLVPLRKQDVPFLREFLLVLGGLVLLIACANVANMMLARAAGRLREIAVRLSLGAGRARLVRQLLTESLLLAAGAAIPAYPLCIWFMHLFSRFRMPWPIPVSFDLTPDWRALVFTFAVTAATGLAFGIVPARQAARSNLVSSLREGGGGVRRRRALGMCNGLMLGQIVASLSLLLLTGYLGFGIQTTLGVQEGFNPRNLYLVSLDPVRDGYPPARAAAFFDRLLERLKSTRGVVAACLTDTLPVATDGNAGVQFAGLHDATGSSTVPCMACDEKANAARAHLVGRDYFETAGIRILAGRSFQRKDEADDVATVIVSQYAVDAFWKNQDPIGQRIQLRNQTASGGFGMWPGTMDYRSRLIDAEIRTFEVIGVAGDVSEDIIASKKHPAIYFPLRPADYAQPSLRGVTLMLRAAPGFDAIGAVRREIANMDSAITPFNATSMTEHIAQFMGALSGASWTYGLLGFFGVVLASVGLAGMTAFSVATRAHEIGVRMALGAQKSDVLALVMKEGATLVLVGTGIGLALAWAGIRSLSAAFFTLATVKASNPVLLAAAPTLLAALALAACYIPARRSTRIDPAVTLRAE